MANSDKVTLTFGNDEPKDEQEKPLPSTTESTFKKRTVKKKPIRGRRTAGLSFDQE